MSYHDKILCYVNISQETLFTIKQQKINNIRSHIESMKIIFLTYSFIIALCRGCWLLVGGAGFWHSWLQVQGSPGPGSSLLVCRARSQVDCRVPGCPGPLVCRAGSQGGWLQGQVPVASDSLLVGRVVF